MADHLDAPGLHSPAPGGPRTDITDVYAFQKPGDTSKSILILNVNPLAPTLATAFDPKALYELNIDTNGDAIAERALRIRFSDSNGSQSATVHLATGQAASFPNDGGMAVISGAPVTPLGTSAPLVTRQGEYKFFAGMRSDPFFFDLLGFLSFVQGNGFDFTHGDFFADKNVFSIALEVPNFALGPTPNVGIWARTLIEQGDTFVVDDRMGRPAINTVFNHGNDKNTFNQIDPTEDRTALTSGGITFVQSFANTIVALSTLGTKLDGKGAYSTDQATGIARILLPDILTFDYSSSGGFLNGRKLADDVINIELGLLTNGSSLTDDATAHGDVLSVFPYVGNPH
jgi:uncharacterized protein DUF4331